MRFGLALLLFLLAAPLHAATVNGILYTSASASGLRVVGFDGSGFTSPFSIPTALSPDWTGMALLFAPEPPPPPAVIPAAGRGLDAAVRSCRAGWPRGRFARETPPRSS